MDISLSLDLSDNIKEVKKVEEGVLIYFKEGTLFLSDKDIKEIKNVK